MWYSLYATFLNTTLNRIPFGDITLKKMKGDHFGGVKDMNKQKTRYTPFSGKYRMPVIEFCHKYGISLKLIMHRMNVLYWEDFDALVIPQELGDTTADKVRRALKMLESDWDKESIAKRLGIPVEVVTHIEAMDDYKKQMFLTMESYFYLDPAKVDLSKIFVEVGEAVR